MKKGYGLLFFSILILGFAGFLFAMAYLTTGTGGGNPFSGKDKVAVIEIRGGIFDPKETLDQLNRVYENDALKALILRIDSPGGAVSPSQEIYDAVLRVKEKKKVVVSMGTVAASGGYYIAVAADTIVALPGTITGSIGILMDYTNIQGLLSWLKVHAEILKSGEMKDVGSPLRPITPEERAYLQALLEDMHRQFIETVARGRQLTMAEVEALADGRIFTGEQAFDLGLVDELGGQQRAVEIVQDLLDLKVEPELVYPKKKKTSFIELLAEGQAETTLLKWYYFLREGRALYWTKGMLL